MSKETAEKAVSVDEHWSCEHCGKEGWVRLPASLACDESYALLCEEHNFTSPDCEEYPRAGERRKVA